LPTSAASVMSSTVTFWKPRSENRRRAQRKSRMRVSAARRSRRPAGREWGDRGLEAAAERRDFGEIDMRLLLIGECWANLTSSQHYWPAFPACQGRCKSCRLAQASIYPLRGKSGEGF